MDAVSTVLPGVAGGSAPAADADGQSPQGVFPAALEQALARPAPTPTGSTPPVDGGQVLPGNVVKAVAEPGLIDLPATVDATDSLVPEAGQALPVVPAVPDPAAVVDALDDIATGQNAVPAVSANPDIPAAPAAPAVSEAPNALAVSVSPAAAEARAKSATPAVPARDGKVAVDDSPEDNIKDSGRPHGVLYRRGHDGNEKLDGHGKLARDALALAATGDGVPALATGEGKTDAGHGPRHRPSTVEGTGNGQVLAGWVPHRAATEAQSDGPKVQAGTASVSGGERRDASVERSDLSATSMAVASGAEAAMAAQVKGAPDLNESGPPGSGNELAALVALPPRAAAADSPPRAELPLAATPGSPEFSHELGERLLWLVREGVHEARLQLNPRDLGPIEVRLGVSDGAAQVSFSAQHAGTAAAVQQSLPQLRELLAQQGLQLGQAEVSQQQPGAGQQTPQQERSAAGDARGPAGRGVDEPFVGERVRVIGRGLVDAYA